MEMQLTGKTVIVTGASKGLGKAIAKEFAVEGAAVMLASRNESALHKSVEEIKQATGNNDIDFTVCDMTNSEQIIALVEKTAAWKGTVDVLINNTGGPPPGLFSDMTDAHWYDAFELNVLSFVRTIRQVIPYMKKQQGGHIINITSSSIKQSIDQLILSNTMRPGVLGLTKSLSQELSVDNILINTIGPGRIKTERIEEINKAQAEHANVSPEEMQQQAEEQIPMQRLGEPSEFAKAVVFFASGANTYITGQSLVVDGGLVKAL